MAKSFEYAASAQNLIKHEESDLDFTENFVRRGLLSLANTSLKQVPVKREFRTSSLPFCPILGFLREDKTEDYKKSHYTSTGTAIHTTVQSWMSIAPAFDNVLWGNWKCTGCGAIKKHQFKPRKLCDCAMKASTGQFYRNWPKHWTYDEVEYDYHGLSGHIDCILMPKPDFWIVLDIKTSELSKKKSRSTWTADKVSSPNYVAQVRTYATVLDLVFHLPVKSWVLANTERGKPITSISDFHLHLGQWSHKHSLKWDTRLKSAVDNDKRLTRLEKAIEAGDKKTADKALKSIIVNRPCHSREDYNSFMKYGFYSGECKMCSTCFNGSNKSVYDRVLLELEKIAE